jgi:hypothetical protein
VGVLIQVPSFNVFIVGAYAPLVHIDGSIPVLTNLDDNSVNSYIKATFGWNQSLPTNVTLSLGVMGSKLEIVTLFRNTTFLFGPAGGKDEDVPILGFVVGGEVSGSGSRFLIF